MLQHKILLDPINYRSKPDSSEVRKINNRIIRYPTEIDIVELSSQLVLPNAKTWIPAYLEGKRNNKSWKSQSIFALDFDSGITIEQVLDRLKEYRLGCTFAYATFSDSIEKPKFRVIWQLNDEISDRGTRDEIQLALMTLFPEADKSCKDASRIFFGGKELIYTNYDYCLDISKLLIAFRMFRVKDVKPEHLSQELKRLDKRVEKCVKNGTSFNKYKEASRFHTVSEQSQELLKVDWDYLRSEVKILDDFMRGEWLYHMDLFGLATNLIHIHGGSKLFKECLDLNPNYTRDKYHLTGIAKYYDYSPTGLENFSPYEEDWLYINLLQAARKGKIVRLEPHQVISLEEAEAKLSNAIREALADNSNSIWIIKKATALGGTESLLDLEGVTIALPNHDLKSEISERFRVEHLVTPELPFDSINAELAKRLKHLFSIGSYGIALDLVKDESVRNDALAKYWDGTLKAYRSRKTVLTTHSKALFIDFENHDTVIFDEDPMSHILEVSDITLDDLNRLAQSVSNEEDRKKLERYVKIITEDMDDCVEATKEVRFNDFQAIEDTVINNKLFASSVLKFLCSEHYVKDSEDKSRLHFLKHNSLNSNTLAHKKIIIMSATADESFYRKLYGDRVKFVDISNVETKGVIVQNADYSYSRASLKSESVYKKVQEKVKDLLTITFIDYKPLFINAVPDIHLGKCSGFDELKGENIAVVGTPHLRVSHYLLYAKALGIKVYPQDFKLKYLTVRHKGIQFRFPTFVRPELQLIQFHFIEEQLIQAIGRARALRYPVVILVFSNFPLAEARLFNEMTEVELELELERIYLEQCLTISTSKERPYQFTE